LATGRCIKLILLVRDNAGIGVNMPSPDAYGLKGNGTDKYGLSQSDFYQLQAYGQSYLDGQGDVVLIYPKTATFDRPLPVFEFPKLEGLRLWVLPFCLKSRRLAIPHGAPFANAFCG
jgi:5-methylcytosine-specific restriction enzyme subunit McrC